MEKAKWIDKDYAKCPSKRIRGPCQNLHPSPHGSKAKMPPVNWHRKRQLKIETNRRRVIQAWKPSCDYGPQPLPESDTTYEGTSTSRPQTSHFAADKTATQRFQCCVALAFHVKSGK